MKLLVGLGNPGKEYERTRHNVGFWVVDRLAQGTDWQMNKSANAFSVKRELAGEVAELFKPQTFMNNSGTSVAYAAKKHDLPPKDLVVIHDDLDVPLGEVRIRLGGGAAGHNGVASVAYHLQSPDFWRVRIGIGPHQPDMISKRTADTSGFVLTPFHPDERPVVEKVLDMVCSFLESNSPVWEPITLHVDASQK